jgi:D-alanyl-D-alanine carboxypeptidase (penicillin-binding protein 5/6)
MTRGKVLAAGMAACLLLSASACGGGGSDSGHDAAPAMETPAELQGGGADQADAPTPVQGGSASDAAPPAPPEPTPMPVPAVPAEPPITRDAHPAPWAATPAPNGVPAPDVSAIAAVVVDEASGTVLYEKNAYTPLPPASTTKIATAILAIEHGGLDEHVVTDVDASLMPRSSVMGLRPGDVFTVRDLLYGLMLPSGNDAALAIGRYVAGSDAEFVARMNHLLWRLGMERSSFANPHGLGNPNHLVTARDLAMLARYGMTLPEFQDIMATYSYTAVGSRTIGMVSANSFTFSYPGADGAKIGYTRSAGNTLVAWATRNGHRLYAVVLNSSNRDAEAARLLDWAFANHTWQ